ncbi:MAG: 4-hydroxy-tetrahydrodipicolinate synthase [Bacteroidota bacterium]|nr:4-hydroxy-tetrahydrodipicolinate synthase [Bacteroidota bacterium]
MENHKFSGTGVAVVTPFKKDKSIDFPALEKLIEHLIANKVDYLVVLGTTAEGATQTSEEKNELVQFFKKINNKRVKLIIGMGGNNTYEITGSIKEFDFDGISGILSVCPYYNKPNQKGLYEHFSEIAKVSPVDIILYNVPGRTGSNMAAETTLQLAREFSNIVAIKEASGNFGQIGRICNNKPKHFAVISGDDALTLPLISIGASGVISVTANAFPDLMSKMVHHALKGNLFTARNLHYDLLDIINTLFEEGNPAGIKAALQILGIIDNNLRLPLTPLSQTTFIKLAKQMKKLDTKRHIRD